MNYEPTGHCPLNCGRTACPVMCYFFLILRFYFFLFSFFRGGGGIHGSRLGLHWLGDGDL